LKKNILKILLTLIVGFIFVSSADAASYSINASTTNTTKGNRIRLTISGNGVTGRFNVSSSNSSVVSISEDRAWIENNSYTITLNALNTGSATITVTPNGVSDSNGNSISLSSKSIKITVSAPREKSNNNNLSSLSIDGFDISPSFDNSIQSYSATVPEGTKSIEVHASASDPYATVRGTGTQDLSEGNNVINIVVRSEKGSEKIYTLNVLVKDENPIEINLNNKKYTLIKVKDSLTNKPSTFKETTINIDETEIPAFKNEVANITLVGLKDEEGKISLFIYKDGEYFNYNEIKSNSYSLIPTKFDKELDLIKTTVNLNNEEIEAYKYNEKTNYVIINATNLETGKTGLYLIDPSNNSAIVFDETLLEKEAIVNDNTLENYTYIIIAFAGALFLMLIVLISLLRNLKKKQEKINKFVQKQEAKIEATRKLNDVVEEVKKIAEEEKEQPKEDKKTKKKNQKKEKQEKIKVEEIQVDENTKEIKKILDDNEEVFDLFEDEKKKKKKK